MYDYIIETSTMKQTKNKQTNKQTKKTNKHKIKEEKQNKKICKRKKMSFNETLITSETI